MLRNDQQLNTNEKENTPFHRSSPLKVHPVEKRKKGKQFWSDFVRYPFALLAVSCVPFPAPWAATIIGPGVLFAFVQVVPRRCWRGDKPWGYCLPHPRDRNTPAIMQHRDEFTAHAVATFRSWKVATAKCIEGNRSIPSKRMGLRR